ncbi:hypothetical protein D3C73_1411530 [compost metagenome]
MQQVGDEPDHTLGLIADDPDEPYGKLRVIQRPVIQRFYIALDRRQRRPQLMRYVRHEFTP